MSAKVLIVVAGPTAVGKTGFAVRLAGHLDTEVISADSRQFYKEMTIGTAKPMREEMGNVSHHLVDFLSVERPFNAYDFEVAALDAIGSIFKRHDQAIVVGGSGLYIQAVCHGIDYMPDIPQEVRKRVKTEMEEKGLDDALKRLQAVDPAYFEETDRKNPARIRRGLEVFEVSGRPFSSFRKGKKTIRDFRIVKVGLERNRRELYERIELRVDDMIERGLFEEAESLYERRHLSALNTVGYKEIFGFLDGNYNREEAIRLLKRNSRRYAKRQMTWFKKDPDFIWFHPDQFEEALENIKNRGNLARRS